MNSKKPITVSLKMIYIIFGIAMLCSAESCQDKSENKRSEIPSVKEVKIEKENLTTIQQSLIDNQISEEFYSLVQFADSSGYICDSLRRPNPARLNESNEIIIDKYRFYRLSPKETTLFFELRWWIQMNEQLDSLHKTLLIPDSTLYIKAESVTAYLYIEKSYFNKTGNGYYKDGIIEEWKFKNDDAAKAAAENLVMYQSLFFNRGFYICYLRNNLYIFHSRAAGFYTPLKNMWLHFEKSCGAIMPEKANQRKNW
jgi:hypothetical protein